MTKFSFGTKTRPESKFMASLFHEQSLMFYPELLEMFENIDLNSPDSQEKAVSAIEFFANDFNGSDVLKFDFKVVENSIFNQYQLKEESKELAEKLTLAAAFIFDMMKNERTQFLPDVSSIREKDSDWNVDDEDWVRTIGTRFSLMSIITIVTEQ